MKDIINFSRAKLTREISRHQHGGENGPLGGEQKRRTITT